MNLKLLLSLLLISGMMFVISCGSEEKQPELDQLDSVDELIEGLDSADEGGSTTDVIAVEDTVKTGVPTESEKAVAGGDEQPSESVAPAKPGDYSNKPLVGHIASMNDLVMGGSGKVNKAQAQELANKGNLIVFKSTNGDVYFVYNEDGTFAGKKLANYANNDKVGMLGKSKVVDGLNVFIMTLMESM
jgi:outer membrane protein assembly factor BamB